MQAHLHQENECTYTGINQSNKEELSSVQPGPPSSHGMTTLKRGSPRVDNSNEENNSYPPIVSSIRGIQCGKRDGIVRLVEGREIQDTFVSNRMNQLIYV